MDDDLLSKWSEFEAQVRHVIDDDMKSSKILHLLKNRFAMSTDLVKRQYSIKLNNEAFELVNEVIRSIDKKFLSLGED